MRKLILASCLIGSVSAFSATVKVISFNYVRVGETNNSPLAELCGKVEGFEKSPTFVRAIIDAGSRRPATYNTMADDKGNFCLAVMTYRGNADLTIMGEKQATKARINN